MNFVSIIQSLFVPWILFCITYGVTSFNLHYSTPWLYWLIIAAIVVFVTWLGSEAASAIKAKIYHEAKEPSWSIFLFLTSLVALILGLALGNQLYGNFMETYYNYLSLNNYRYVNVAKMRGEQLMDAARISFDNGTKVDQRKAIGFHNSDTYCVAPITLADNHGVMAELSNYDFWAVGLNCCSGRHADFHCGASNDPQARAGGLRLLDSEARAFYRLAVQQAEGMYHINANHPLFLYWTDDPVAEMDSWKSDGHKFFFIGMIVHFCWQALAVGLGVAGFLRMGTAN